MTATVISNQVSFGQMSNQTISRLVSLNVNMERLAEAIATASSGYTGEDGTEFEGGLFGVQPSDTPGEQGKAYAYAMGQLDAAWKAFWTAASPYVEQLDNGYGGI